MRKEMRPTQLLVDAKQQAQAKPDHQPIATPGRFDREQEEIQCQPGIASAGMAGGKAPSRRIGIALQQTGIGLAATIARQIPRAVQRTE